MMLLIPAAAAALSTTLLGGFAPGKLKLGLLPFLLDQEEAHVLLPGEALNVFLFEDSLQACISAAAVSEKCVGGLLMNEEGRPHEIVMLLRIEEFRADAFCTWVRLVCIGRCSLSGAVRRHEQHGYRVATISPFCDSVDASLSMTVSTTTQAVRIMHEDVASQRRRLALIIRQQAEEMPMCSLDSLDTDQADSKQVNSGMYSLPKSEYIYVGPDKRSTPFGIYDSYESLDDESLNEEEGELCEHVYLGEPWEWPGRLGTCYFSPRDPGELDDDENGRELLQLIVTRRTALLNDAGSSIGSSIGSSQRAGSPIGSSIGSSQRAGSSIGSSIGSSQRAGSSIGSSIGSSQRAGSPIGTSPSLHLDSTAPPLDAPGSVRDDALFDAVRDVWGVTSKEQAQLQLLSFAAAATLSPMERAQALMMQDTMQRLEFARDLLGGQQRLLSELLQATAGVG
jgi:hypothetical protein